VKGCGCVVQQVAVLFSSIKILSTLFFEPSLQQARCTLFAFPRIALLHCNFWTFPSCSLWRQTTHMRYKFGWKPIQTVLLHTIKLLDWLGKAYLKWATAAIAAKGFRNTGLFLCNIHIIDERDAGRISAQHHELFAWNFSALFQNCRRTANNRGTNPLYLTKSLRQPHKTPLLLSCPDISPVPHTSGSKQEQPT